MNEKDDAESIALREYRYELSQIQGRLNLIKEKLENYHGNINNLNRVRRDAKQNTLRLEDR